MRTETLCDTHDLLECNCAHQVYNMQVTLNTHTVREEEMKGGREKVGGLKGERGEVHLHMYMYVHSTMSYTCTCMYWLPSEVYTLLWRTQVEDYFYDLIL